MARENFGLMGYDSYHFAVPDLERSRRFYSEKFGFTHVARAGEELLEKSGQRSLVFGAGMVRVVVSSPDPNHPKASECKAARYLRRHPAGVMSLSFRVQDLDRAWKILERRGATILSEPVEDSDGSGSYRAFEIATPLGDVNFRYVERRGDYGRFAPGFDTIDPTPQPKNVFGIDCIDHVTSNALTLAPLVLWYREVLGMEQFWEIQFHTVDVHKDKKEQRQMAGSGLKSLVYWDPECGIKFANNEPMRPFFRDSQINKFVDDNNGAGVQHIAFNVPKILPTVEEMTRRGVSFLATPGAYYDMLPERLQRLGITNVREPIDEMRRLGILLDGHDDKYMLQIFLRDAGQTYHDPKAGPFFYEIIQRAGDPGFGGGNFRALFESIEREQFAARDQPFD
ncbi:MAG: VOC family protein [Deltaproteobacteria bacterium]|nr:VOC family protein [Deltaproteobacteria bacterium]